MVLYCTYSTARCEQYYVCYSFIGADTHMAKNRKAFKRFFLALSALHKTVNC